MKQLSKVLVGLAAACIVIALILKLRAGGIPTSPLLWLKLGAISLLFSIALSLVSK